MPSFFSTPISMLVVAGTAPSGSWMLARTKKMMKTIVRTLEGRVSVCSETGIRSRNLPGKCTECGASSHGGPVSVEPSIGAVAGFDQETRQRCAPGPSREPEDGAEDVEDEDKDAVVELRGEALNGERTADDDPSLDSLIVVSC